MPGAAKVVVTGTVLAAALPVALRRTVRVESVPPTGTWQTIFVPAAGSQGWPAMVAAVATNGAGMSSVTVPPSAKVGMRMVKSDPRPPVLTFAGAVIVNCSTGALVGVGTGGSVVVVVGGGSVVVVGAGGSVVVGAGGLVVVTGGGGVVVVGGGAVVVAVGEVGGVDVGVVVGTVVGTVLDEVGSAVGDVGRTELLGEVVAAAPEGLIVAVRFASESWVDEFPPGAEVVLALGPTAPGAWAAG